MAGPVHVWCVVIGAILTVSSPNVESRATDLEVDVIARDRRSTVCYGDLGCFSTGGAFTSLHRLLNLNPESPTQINTRFLLFTRQNPTTGHHQFLNPNDFNSLTSSHFDPSRPSKFVVHGFLENGFADWLSGMKDELLKHGDYNVVLVDWGGGSSIPYTQATANTRVVGAVIAKLIQALQTHKDASPSDFHLIGHSLGAHICGYAGERTPNLGRISGLDPADPYFQYTDPSVRLDPTDANFVDVMHTNGASILTLGYGVIQACGHVDYFPNEGLNQPGCDRNPVDKLLLEGDIYNGAKQVVACSHLRAHKYFTESINSKCAFTGYSCKDYNEFQRGSCLPCHDLECGYMGFHADRAKPARGQTLKQFYLKTGDTAPYCRYHYQIEVQFGNLAGTKTETGTIFMNIFGSNGQTGEHQLTDDPLEVHPGHTYGFVLTSTHDIGDVSKIDFRWSVDSHWYNPLTWSLITSHSMRINSVQVVNGVTEVSKKICGFNTQVNSDDVQSFNQAC